MKNQDNDLSGTMLDAANERIVHLYTAGRNTIRKLFKRLTPLEYEFLMLFSEKDSGKLYLSDIADKTGTALSHVSRVARLLSERRLVLWRHDGDGQSGTYIQITPDGNAAREAQKEVIHLFYRQVVAAFGENNFDAYLEQMNTLGDIMRREIKKMEDGS